MSLHRILILISLCVFLCLQTACNRRDADSVSNQTEPAVLDSLRYYWKEMKKTKLADQSAARMAAEKALRLSRAKGNLREQAYTSLYAGTVYLESDPDSSLLLTNNALALAKQSIEDSILQTVYYNLAYLNYLAGSYPQSIKLLDTAISYADERKDSKTVVNSLLVMSNIDRAQGNTEQARMDLIKALTLAKQNKMDVQTGAILGNLGGLAGSSDSAVLLLREAAGILSKVPYAKEELTSVMLNLANYMTNPDSAVVYYNRAIELAKKASLSELEIAAYNDLGCTYIEQGKFGLAEICLRDHAIYEAQKTGNNDWLSTAQESYAELLEKKGDFRNAYMYQKESAKSRSRASKQLASTQTRILNALLMARIRDMEIREKNEEIQQKNETLKLTFLTIAVIVLLAMLAVLYFLWKLHRKNLRMKEQEMETARRLAKIEEKENNRMAMQLHDTVRPLRSVLINDMKTLKFPDEQLRDSVTAKIMNAIKALRNISHRLNSEKRELMSFNELIKDSVKEFVSGDDLNISLELPEAMPTLDRETQSQFYFIIQELLMNAEKYVIKGDVKISFAEEMDRFFLIYGDNGPGFKSDERVSQGLGLMHITERAVLMGGTASLDTRPGKGTSWTISIPLNKNESQ